MGFFSDLKEDLSQAVNEMMPDEAANTVKDGNGQDGNENIAGAEEKQQESGMDEAKEGLSDTGLKAEDPANEGYLDEDFAYEDFVEKDLLDEDAVRGAEEETMSEEEALRGISEEMQALRNISEELSTEETVRTVEETDEYKGDEKDMEINKSRAAADETSILTAGMTLTGDIVSEGSLDLIGKVNGNIDILGKLNITGHVNGNSKASEIVAEGAKINGEIVSEGAVKIGASTVVVGNITATSASIAGAVKGDIDVQGPVVLDASAIVIPHAIKKMASVSIPIR